MSEEELEVRPLTRETTMELLEQLRHAAELEEQGREEQRRKDRNEEVEREEKRREVLQQQALRLKADEGKL